MLSRIVSVFVAVLFIFGGFSSRMAEASTSSSSSVVLLPFDAQNAGKYAYLKDGLRSMLASRLAVNDGIQVRDYTFSQKELNEIKALKKQAMPRHFFGRFHANYVVTGSLQAKGDELNLQVVFYSAADNKPMQFSMSAEKEEEILPALDALATEIGGKVAVAVPETAAIAEKPSSSKIEPVGGMPKKADNEPAPLSPETIAAFRTVHPERAYKTGIYSRSGIVAENGGLNIPTQGVRKSSPISMKIVSLAVGDVDGDGVDDIVLASSGELRTYHFIDGRFRQIAKMSLPAQLKVQAMYLADLNHDGRMQIYISATDDDTISSLVVELGPNNTLKTLHKGVQWYLRPLEIPGKGMILAGQSNGPGSDSLLFPGIYELSFVKGSNVPKQGKKLAVPKELNIFDFTFADLNGDGKIETVAVSQDEKLQVYDSTGKIIWVSERNYGGSTNFLGSGRKTHTSGEMKIFIPTRIIAADMNGDHKQEILIGSNQREQSSNFKFLSYFRNTRVYDGGFVSCLSWNGSAMTELWHTNTLGGLIADYGLDLPAVKAASRNKGSKAEAAEPGAFADVLFVGQASGSGLFDIFSLDNETEIYAYDVGFMHKKPTLKK